MGQHHGTNVEEVSFAVAASSCLTHLLALACEEFEILAVPMGMVVLTNGFGGRERWSGHVTFLDEYFEVLDDVCGRTFLDGGSVVCRCFLSPPNGGPTADFRFLSAPSSVNRCRRRYAWERSKPNRSATDCAV